MNYRQVIDNFLNLYEPIGHQPKEGDFSHIQALVYHIFGEQYELGMDYLSILEKYFPGTAVVDLNTVKWLSFLTKSKFLDY